MNQVSLFSKFFLELWSLVWTLLSSILWGQSQTTTQLIVYLEVKVCVYTMFTQKDFYFFIFYFSFLVWVLEIGQQQTRRLILYKFVQAEMTLKQLESLSPPIMKQVLPLVEQLPPLYMDLVKGREDFTPKPEETRKLVCYV